VDKRVSARGSSDAPTAPPVQPPEPSEPTPAPEAAAPPPEPEPSPPPVASPGDAPEPEEQVWTPEQEAQAQQIAKEIAERPSEDWVLNVAVTLANVAGAKLDMGLADDARLAIDAFEALVNGIGGQLEGAEAPLRQTLAQLQMAYAQSMSPPPPSP
jgi:outer membrane biosynthesis protein TonB